MSAAELSPGERARWACSLEVLARKPGNVNRFYDFQDVHLMDFLASAQAIAGPMDRARETGIGAAVLEAVKATRAICPSNTNLGMILLLAPLAARDEPGRSGVVRVLGRLSRDDARFVYEAIRLANPGGLGRVGREDVAEAPNIGLIEAMRLAEDRDSVARQYVYGYSDIYDTILGRIRRALRDDRSLELAIVWAHMEMMAAVPDTLVARKRGKAVAEESAKRAREILDAGWPDAPGSRKRFVDFDTWLRADGHARNPGTTADLVCAGLFEALSDGTMSWPVDWKREFPQRLCED